MKKYEQVIQRICSLLENGILKPDQQAPSVRSMVKQTGLSLMTVLEGYRRLENMGILIARQRRGYYVRPRQFWHAEKVLNFSPARAESSKLSPQTVKVDDKAVVLFDEAFRPDVIPMGCGIPCEKFFPSQQLSVYLSRIVRTNPHGVNRYCVAPGELELRKEFSLRLLESGCNVSEDQVMVTGGGTDGMILAMRCLTNPGDTIAIESPGYFGFYRAASFLRLKVIEIPCEPQTGLALGEFKKLIRSKNKIKCLLLCSNASNPTGATMSIDAKRELADLANKAGITIIEDDTYGELFFGEDRPRTLKSFDNDNIIQIGGMGKTLCPGYRIGWLAGGKYHEEIKRLHGIAYLSISVPNQLAVARFLHEGGMAKHLRFIRQAYEENIKLFQLAVMEHFPDKTRITDPSGGHFLWLQMPEKFDSIKLAEQAIKHKISIAPGILFSAGEKYLSSFRLNCAIPWSQKLNNAIKVLAKLSAQQIG